MSAWLADGNADDAFGSAEGTLAGSTAFAAGRFGQAFSFDGAGTVLLPDDAFDSLAAGDITIVGWLVNQAGVHGAWEFEHSWGLLMLGSTPIVVWSGTGGLSSMLPVTFSEWHHIASVYNGGTAHIYVDGVLGNSGALAIGNGTTNRLGASLSLSNFRGLLDEVAIFDTALTQEQITAVMDLGLIAATSPDPGVFITSPADGAGFFVDEGITFTALTTLTPPVTFEWSSDVDGVFGGGESLTWSSLSPGAHAITVTGQGALGVVESDQISLTVQDTANLVVTSLGIAGSPVAGGTISVSWEAMNDGGVAAVGAWSDTVRLQRSPGEAGTLLGSRPAPGPAAPGATYQSQLDVVLPDVAGEHLITVVADAGDAVEEGVHEDDNTAAGAALIILAPDLVADGIDDPGTITAGEIATLTWTDRNIGTAPASGTWRDRIYLSDDASIGSDVLIGDLVRLGPIVPDEMLQSTEGVQIPLALAGTYHLVLWTDANGAVLEGGQDSNNQWISPFTVQVDPAEVPDLRVDGATIAHPSSGEGGESVTVSWQGTNDGTLATQGSFTSQLYLSADAMLGAGDQLLGTAVQFTPVAEAGGTYDLDLEVELPDTPGTRHLIVVTDSNDVIEEAQGEANNVSASLTTITISVARLPDLAVTLGELPATVQSSSSMTVTWSVTSGSGADANGSWSDAIYLSADPIFDGGDQLVRLQPSGLSALPSGQSYQRSASITIPVSYEPVTWYVIARVDAGFVLAEADEANNAAVSAAISATATPAPDLVVEAVNAPPSGVFGSTIALDWTGRNAGNRPAGAPWSDVVFLSTDAVLSAEDAPIHLQPLVGLTVPPQATYARAIQLALPLSNQLPAGDWYVIVKTDANLSVTESDEQNNALATGPIVIDRPPLPDLVIGSVQVPADFGPGETVTIGFDVRNEGQEPLDDTWHQRVYLSGDGSVNGAVLLADQIVSQSIEPGGSVPVMLDLPVPDPATDEVYVVICTDAQDQVVEADEQNNCGVSAPVPVRRPDLAAIDVQGPSAASAGESIEVTWEIENVGSAAAVPFWSDSVAIASIGTPQQGQLLSTALRTAPVPASTTYQVTHTVTIPQNLEGTYVFTVRANAGGLLRETGDASNNLVVAAVPIEITQPPRPNLEVTSVSAPPPLLAGESGTVTWTVTNTAADAEVTRSWVDRVYASTDTTFGPDDALLASMVGQPPLAAGGQDVGVAEITATIAPGDYHLLVQTDATGLINEGTGGGESDNVTIAAQPLIIQGVTVTVGSDLPDDEGPLQAPVQLSGTATVAGTSQPAADVPVTVRSTVRNYATTLAATTDASGHYAVQLQPLPDIGGLYSLDARSAGGSFQGVQDQFVLWGTKLAPGGANHVMGPGASVQGSFTVTNLADLPLTSVSVEIVGAPAGVQVETFLSGGSIMAPLESRTVTYTIEALELLEQPAIVQLLVKSDQTSAVGSTSSFALAVDVQPEMPVLTATPSPLIANMVVGEVKYVEVEVRNVGLAPTGPLLVDIVQAPWLTMISPAQLPALAPGDEVTVVLQLAPQADLPLGPYGATPGLVISDATDPGVHVTVNMTFTAASENRGDLLVLVTNEFSYWGADQSDPANYPQDALVEVRDVTTGALVASGTPAFLDVHLDWDNDPEDEEQVYGVLFTDLLEANYQLRVTAPGHSAFQGITLNNGGVRDVVGAFLPRQMVTYTWTVVPIDFEDEYLITLEAVFETQVPAPVVVLEPNVLDFTTLESSSQYIELVAHNHGLVRADAFHLVVQDSSRYEIIPLSEAPQDIPAMSSVTIPILLIDHGFGIEAVALDGACDPVWVKGNFKLECGETKFFDVPLAVRVKPEGCPGSAPADGIYWPPSVGGGGGIGSGGSSGGASNGFSNPPNYQVPCSCDVCKSKCFKGVFDAVGGDVGEIVSGFGGIGASALSGDGPLGSIGECVDLRDCVVGIIDGEGLGEFLRCTGGKAAGCVPDVPFLSDICRIGKACEPTCCDPTDCFGDGGMGFPAGCHFPCDAGAVYELAFPGPDDRQEQTAATGSGGPFNGETDDPLMLELNTQAQRMIDVASPFAELFGTSGWLRAEPGDKPVLASWLDLMADLAEPASGAGQTISNAERAILLAEPYPASLTPAEVNQFIDRWNLTIEYAAMGIFEIGDVPPGFSLDFIAIDRMLERALAAEAAIAVSAAEGFEVVHLGMVNAVELLQQESEGGEGICASVTIQLQQNVAITRQAFEATLVINNEGDADAVEGVLVDIEITDGDGETVNDRFVIFSPELDGIANVDGSGVLLPGASATARWVILPGDEAAPEDPQVYHVGGTLQYALAGNPLNLPLYPVPITVLPNASLEMRYFLESTVFADDPFTPEVEPSVPFSLGLLVRNNGAGEARNFHITTAQPQIIDNELGLLIDFDLIATQVEDQMISPQFAVSLGDIGPDETRVARWLMISSLQGEFVDFDAEVESLNGLDEPDFSLIDSIETFDLTHVVRVEHPGDDGRPDFLVDELLEVESLPDHVHTSGGAIEPVDAITDAIVTIGSMGSPTAQVDAGVGGEWFYIRIDDPYDGALPLTAVQRSDGSELLMDWNAWQTNRINHGEGPTGVVERFVHLFDRGGDGSYTLIFDADSTAPAAPTWFAVDAVPALGEVHLPMTPGEPVSDPRDRPLAKLTVQFSESIDPATLNGASVVVEGYGLDGKPVDLGDLAVTTTLRLSNLLADLEFDPPIPAQARYCIQLVGVTDPAGNGLTEETAQIDLTLLVGDATGDRRVNNTDVGGIVSLLGTDPIDPGDLYQVRSDLDLDGVVDAFDLAIALDHRGLDARFVPGPCTAGLRSGQWLVLRNAPGSTSTSEGATGAAGGAALIDGDGSQGWSAAAAEPVRSEEPSPDSTPVWIDFGDGPRALPVDFGRIAVEQPPFDLDVPAVLGDYAIARASVRRWPTPRWWIADVPASMADEPGFRALTAALTRQGLYVSPVLVDDAGGVALVPATVMVRFGDAIPAPWIDRVLDRFAPGQPEIEAGLAGIGQLYRVTFAASDGLEVLARATALARRSDVQFCEPDFVMTGHAPQPCSATQAAHQEVEPVDAALRLAVLAPGAPRTPRAVIDALVQPSGRMFAVETHSFGTMLNDESTWCASRSALIDAAMAAADTGAGVLVLDAAGGFRAPSMDALASELRARGAVLLAGSRWLEPARGGAPRGALAVVAIEERDAAARQGHPPIADVAVEGRAAGFGDRAALHLAAISIELLHAQPSFEERDLEAVLCAVARPDEQGWSRCGLLRAEDVRATPGDVSLDGRIDWNDLVLLINEVGRQHPSGGGSADVNEDGRIDGQDVTRLLEALMER